MTTAFEEVSSLHDVVQAMAQQQAALDQLRASLADVVGLQGKPPRTSLS